jgi:SSS family solute:Na+ symporter
VATRERCLTKKAPNCTDALTPARNKARLARGSVSVETTNPWFLGVIGGAGALTAMVPAAIFILTAATLFAKNLYRPIFAPAMTDDQVAKLARAMVVVLSLISLYFAIYSSSTLVSLLLLGYAGVIGSPQEFVETS